jgi:hypothetical protein
MNKGLSGDLSYSMRRRWRRKKGEGKEEGEKGGGRE